MDEKLLKVLLRKRDSLKTKVALCFAYTAKLESSLIALNVKPPILEQAEWEALDERLSRLAESMVEFESIQTEIETLVDESELEGHYKFREEFENDYSVLIVKSRKLMPRSKSPDSRISTPDSAAAPAVNGNGSGFQYMQYNHLKLPTIPLPKFEGDLLSWLDFRKKFNSLIHSGNQLDLVAKFHYLKSSISGTPEEIISGLAFTPDNYELAWDLICNRFNNDRRLINAHVEALFNLETPAKESAPLLRKLLDGMNKHLRALKLLGQPTDSWDTPVVYLITNKLDIKTFRSWEEFKTDYPAPTVENLRQFLQNRCDLLDSINDKSQKPTNSSSGFSKPPKSSSRTFNVAQASCPACGSSHLIYNCDQFTKLPQNEMLALVRTKRLCINCLKPGHKVNVCKSGTCRKCSEKHHTLLHFHKPNQPAASTGAWSSSGFSGQGSSNQASSSQAMHCTTSSQHILLSTAVVQVKAKDGTLHDCRVLLDSASQSNFITAALVNKLGLKQNKINHVVSGFNAHATSIAYQANLRVESRHSSFSLELSCLIVSGITDRLPSIPVAHLSPLIPSNIILADPGFSQPREIDMLIGASHFWNLLSIGQISLGNRMPILQKTLFGWIVSGPVQMPVDKIQGSFCGLTRDDELSNQIKQFWEVEEIGQKAERDRFSSEEQFCEDHFVQNITRESNGRIAVKIPFKEDPHSLGDSYNNALKRFQNIERKMERNAYIKAAYSEFMTEYIDLGHMTSDLDSNSNSPRYFLPHHHVLRPDSLSTKLRVVFDASSKTSSGKSLNDIQAVGPVIQQELFPILLRFRQHNIAITADISKMYRQVLIHPSERQLQSILWRGNVGEPIQVFKLNTVTYGTASASFLAIRALHETAYNYANILPKASEIVLTDFYVDDLLTGASDEKEAKSIFKDVETILSSGCFELKKWVSSNPTVLSFLNPSEPLKVLQIGLFDRTKTLGLCWAPNRDHFEFSINLPQGVKPTKRSVLSCIAQIFDPLGLASPITVAMKIFIQSLWQAHLSWDESFSSALQSQWFQLRDKLEQVGKLQVPRRIVCENPSLIEAHGFSDANQLAYGACIYLRSVDQRGRVYVNLLCSKTRVAPIKSLSIPRLELCAAQLLVKLMTRVSKALNIKIDSIHYWTDSTIVLAWLRMEPNRLNTFVSNRVSSIQRTSSSENWYHVGTSENPADLLTRGLDLKSFSSSQLWWHGPVFLSSEHFDMEGNVENFETFIEVKPKASMVNVVTDSNCFKFPFSRFSSFDRMQNTVAYILRFLTRKCQRKKGYLDCDELSKAQNLLLQLSQKESFPEEYACLSAGKHVSAKSRLLALKPIMLNGLIRVGGRLRNSDFKPDKKYPIILDPKHHLTRLLFEREHKRLFHPGAQLLLASLREGFWPLSGRSAARKVARECAICRKAKPRTLEPVMGDLPRDRLVGNLPFQAVGIDYAGPLTIKDRQGRGCKHSKAYIAVFVCFLTKAIHIELVTSLTADSFSAALRRFISRRGKPFRIYSDNATNFVGAASELKRLFEFINQNNNCIAEVLAQQSIDWSFIPPGSPHFGGLWEAGVRSLKHHLKRVTKDMVFTFEELYTLLTEIEAILNSRPLTPLSADPSDLNPLTPAHMLTGRSLLNIPEADLSELSRSRLSWSRWAKEYVSEMQARAKWKKHGSEVPLGALVLIKDNNVPPLQWRLGRVVEKHCGSDGVCRVVSLKTQRGIIKRAVVKISPLFDWEVDPAGSSLKS